MYEVEHNNGAQAKGISRVCNKKIIEMSEKTNDELIISFFSSLHVFSSSLFFANVCYASPFIPILCYTH